MSTKTTFKRVAAVAALALTLGGLSAVSANAGAGDEGNLTVTAAVANSGGDSATETATATAGANNFVSFALKNQTTTYQVVVTNGTAVTSATTATGSGTSTLIASPVSASPYKTNFTVPTPSNGTITVKTYAFSGGVLQTSSTSSLTITVGTATPSTYASATAYIGLDVSAERTATTEATDANDAVGFYKVATASSTAVARIDVNQLTAASAAVASSATKSVTVSTANAGLVGTGADATAAAAVRGPSASVAAGSATTGVNAHSIFFVYADGRSGVSTITVAVDGVTVATKTFNFGGTTVAKLALDPNALAQPVNTPKSGTSTYYIAGLDSNGVASAVTLGTLYAVSADSTIATATVSVGSSAYAADGNGTNLGEASVTVTGVARGTTTINICDTATCASTGKLNLAIPVTVTGASVGKVALSFDQDTYAPGQLMTVLLTVTSTNGDALGDGSYSNLIASTGIKTNVTLLDGSSTDSKKLSLASNASTTITGGVHKYYAYAPFASGAVVITSAEGTNTANVAVGGTAAVLTATATVATASDAASQAAIDAAQEATDAANAAYDAANNAMDSADAATAAAQDAADNASAALAAVTSLSATVAKLVKSVAAIAAALAKVQKKIGA